ncbi:MAG TPA: bifunctional rhamnulose-1-phosphate aldolase/short-chain dehydrogenase [Candidatus Methylacidiphilales bacterium]|nr:bifunctional rhamnulose-1-phosphate aldolase/short-chain dehydrogenase [Candidatus Methylacidiphilales bacterium]
MSVINFSFVNYLWDDAQATKLDPVARLVYRSNLLGSDQRITNTGGGNTSAKLEETDPLTGKPVTVLWVKGSGGDLRTSKRENFSSLYQDKLLALQDRYAAADERGPKTAIEDAMVEMYLHATFNLNPRAPSIDTPLHSFIPAKHVDHTHPNAVIAIAAAKNSKELTKKIYGDEVIWTPWQRPGFDLGLQLQKICRENPQAKGVILGQHGLINWAGDDKACYELSLSLIEKAARYLDAHDQGPKTFGGAKFAPLPEAERRATLAKLLPWLRGRVSQNRRFIGTWQDDDATLTFVNSAHASRLAELGTSCPDHFLRTKIKPLYADWNPQSEKIDALKKKLETGLEQYRKDYAAYYQKCRHANSPAMRDANPTVVLIPGLGLIAWGKDKSESRVTAEFYGCAIQVMRGAEAADSYTALPLQEAFDIEYWLLEEAKLQRMPPEKELARQVIAVIGAGSGIGREVALRLIQEGAHVVAVDLNPEGVETTVKDITSQYGPGIGVAGSGISGCGWAVAVSADMTKRESIHAALEQAVLAYGGIDSIAITAGIFVPPDAAGNISEEKWALTFAINVTGAYLVAHEARARWNEQGLRGSLVLTTSANAVVAKKGSIAYDTSKAAANHLIRELAIELAPLIRVNGVAPATVIQGSAMFPRERVIDSLAKYKIPFKTEESTENLTAKLAQFYADRTLTKSPITPADQAEAIFLLLTNRLSKTTGQVIGVDGGLHEAFLR